MSHLLRVCDILRFKKDRATCTYANLSGLLNGHKETPDYKCCSTHQETCEVKLFTTDDKTIGELTTLYDKIPDEEVSLENNLKEGKRDGLYITGYDEKGIESEMQFGMQ
ncbi:hypothetical protein LOAG_06282 [Loa loa]|uniref:Uncharacterized protein n=1 Tax=Loa loa TaxID=7209 RepID=A0A1S0TYQ8_LOALO|nr:hypothetical protein LOAG_06282 [Loa loa]EFO22201.1 hypothetical protein LOAG_06282 [Loa loa]